MSKSIRVCLGIGIITLGIGVIAVAIAMGLGGMKRVDAADTIVFSDNVSGVHSLEFDFPYGDIDIVEGESFSVTISNVVEGDYTSKVIDGIWIISGNSNNKRTKIFGIDLPAISFDNFNWGFGDDYEPLIVVTIPKNIEFENVNINTGAGTVYIESLMGQEVYLGAGAGDISIDTFNSDKKAEFSIGAGKISIEEGDTRNIIINCGVGELDYKGIINERCDIDCGVGRIYMKLDNEYENCYFNIDRGIGNINVKDKGVKTGTTGSSEAKVEFYVSCGVGDIDIDLR